MFKKSRTLVYMRRSTTYTQTLHTSQLGYAFAYFSSLSLFRMLPLTTSTLQTQRAGVINMIRLLFTRCYSISLVEQAKSIIRKTPCLFIATRQISDVVSISSSVIFYSEYCGVLRGIAQLERCNVLLWKGEECSRKFIGAVVRIIKIWRWFAVMPVNYIKLDLIWFQLVLVTLRYCFQLFISDIRIYLTNYVFTVNQSIYFCLWHTFNALWPSFVIVSTEDNCQVTFTAKALIRKQSLISIFQWSLLGTRR